MELREYQNIIIQNIKESLKQGNKKIVIVASCEAMVVYSIEDLQEFCESMHDNFHEKKGGLLDMKSEICKQCKYLKVVDRPCKWCRNGDKFNTNGSKIK